MLRAGEVSFGTLAGDPPLDYFAYLPRSEPNRILVSVHGISEKPADHTERFSDLAERHGVAVVAPHFELSIWRDYQRLGREGKGPRADLALDRFQQPQPNQRWCEPNREELGSRACELVRWLAQFVLRSIGVFPGDGHMLQRRGRFGFAFQRLWLQRGTKCGMRLAVRVTTYLDHRLIHRLVQARCQGAAIVDMAGDATPRDERWPKFTALLLGGWVRLFGMSAVGKVGMMQASS